MSSDDPWSWTVEDVVDWTCRDLPVFAATIPNATLPDTQALSDCLRDGEVTGSVLLSDVDRSFLKEDCGIRQLGRQSTVLRAIKSLQKISSGFSLTYGLPLPTPPVQHAILPSQVSTPPAEKPITPEHKKRAGEVLIDDEHGRKRRKLDLSAFTVNDIRTTLEDTITTKASGSAESTVDLPSRPNGRHQETSAQLSHLPPGKFTLDQVIYGSTAVGRPTLTDQEKAETSDTFYFTAASRAPGQQHFVQRQMRFLLQSSTQSAVRRDGTRFFTFHPYSAKRLLQGQTPSYTLFEGIEDNDRAIRYRLDDEGVIDADGSKNDPTSGSDGWDYLLKKYNNQDDTVLPLVGESTEESDLDSEAEAEIDEEENPASNEGLTREDAEEIFEDVAQQYRERWIERVQPKLELKDAYKEWHAVRRSGLDHKRIAYQNKLETTTLELRLANLRRDLLQNHYSNAQDLVRLCATIQPTIEDLERLAWHRSIWQRKSELPRPQRPVNVAKAEHKQTTKEAGDLPNVHDEVDDLIANENEDASSLADIPIHDAIPGSSPPPLPDVDSDPLDFGDLIDAAAKSDDDGSFLPSEADNRIADLPVKAEPPSSTQAGNTTVDDPIILSSDPAEEPVKPKRTKTKPDLKKDPQDATYEEIDSWDELLLIENQDRKRVVSKIFFMLDREFKRELAERLNSERKSRIWLFVETKKVLDYKAGRHQQPCDRYALLFAKLYACWFQCDPDYWDFMLPEDLYKTVNEVDLNAWAAYTSIVVPRIANFMEPGETIDLSSGEESSDVPKKRRKSRPMDMVAAASRNQAIKRMEQARDSQRMSDSQVLSQTVPGSDDREELITVNTVRDQGEKPVHLNSVLAKRLKNHQIDGVRFLWREVMASGNEGCILAHTMGLGKTCQAISFLVTLKEATDNSSTRKQIRKELRPARVLILCPPAVLPNWLREIDMWSPRQNFFQVFKIDATGNDQQERLEVLRNWSQSTTGSILVMGYPMFQKYVLLEDDDASGNDPDSTSAESTEPEIPVTKKASRKSSLNKLSKQDRMLACKVLKEKANIIIADEAHALKNEKSKVSIAAAKLKGIRIALSGTPLSNATREIFSLVNWVAPNYLGSKAEFEQVFARPIEDGTYRDSTPYQKRKSLKQLEVLRRETEPKIDRQDITALRGSLTSKTEYNFTIPLTDLQTKIYNKYISFISGAMGQETISTVDLFGWISLLVLLVTHPKALRIKLLEPPSKKKKEKSRVSIAADGIAGQGDDESDHSVIGDDHVEKLGLNSAMIQELVSMIPEEADISASYRMVLIKQILELSKEAGDKTLVFSQRLQLLDCLEELLDKMNIKWARIDGSMPSPKREAVLTKFRAGQFDVLLVSTRAGGQGLNMQDANRVIIVDFGFNPTWEEQAVGRAYRLGQKKNVVVYRFVTGGTFEDKLYNMGLFKSSLFQRVVDKKNPERHAKREIKDWIFPPRSVEQTDISEELGKDPLVLDKLIAAQRDGQDCFIRAIKTMETLQRDAQDEPLTLEEQQEVAAEVNRRNEVRKNPGAAWRLPSSIQPGYAAGITLPAGAMPSSTAPVRSKMPHGVSPHFASTQAQPPPASTSSSIGLQNHNVAPGNFSLAHLQNGSIPQALQQSSPNIGATSSNGVRTIVSKQFSGTTTPRSTSNPSPHLSGRPPQSTTTPIPGLNMINNKAKSPEERATEYPSFGRPSQRQPSSTPFHTPPTSSAALPRPQVGSTPTRTPTKGTLAPTPRSGVHASPSKEPTSKQDTPRP
ncbi:SNF2 family N-terminal domain-containing protein 6 [Elsinoe fawcettii]|nr:SNF2 family N-terminal domain-containing protein 6 [Elsinoe fawcettii]